MSGRALTLAFLLVAATAACDRVQGLFGDSVAGKRAALGESLGGLAARGPGPLLSWDAVSGAAQYAVTVSDGTKGRWLWLGPATRVRYGVASASDPDLPSLAHIEPAQVVTLRAGVRYRWFVTALDAQGRLLAHSPVAEFSADGQGAAPAVAAAPAAREAGAAAARPAAAPPASPAALLTEPKVRAYLVYQRELAGAAGEAGSMIEATGRSARVRPDRAARGLHAGGGQLAARGQTGLHRSGLTQEEVGTLAGILSTYYAKRMFLADAQQALARSQAQGRPDPLDDMYRKQVADAAQARADFSRKHGPAAVAAVDACEKDYHATTDLMMKGALKPGR